MAEFDLESIIKKGVEAAINKPVYAGKSITEWAAIGMKAPQWISVKDRLPVNYIKVLVAVTDVAGTFVAVVWREDDNWNDDEGGWPNEDVTHWMPLPEPPEEVSEDA